MLRILRTQEFFNSACSTCNKFCRSLTTKLDTMTEIKEIKINHPEKRLLEEDTTNNIKKQKTEAFVRIKKKNCAMMLGYLGKDYYGMQRNPGMNTIEEELIKAMFKAKLINSEAFETIQSIHFQRAARTDKGVSAVRQVVSLKLPENPCKDSINENLPKDIKVFAIKRVTKGFNSKSQCDARTYSYTLPTFAFAPEHIESYQETGEFQDIEKRIQHLSTINGKPYSEYRLPEDRKQQLSDLLKYYEGTHNFHNFTRQILPLDPRAKRYIMSFVADEPFIVNDMEFITLKVKGQSFMMHQIRKMVALVIGILRDIVTKEDFEKEVFETKKYEIVRAPSLGLMLNIVHYDYYNKRYGTDGIHETLDWAECEKEVTEFEKNHILKYVIDTELKEKSMLEWLASLNVQSFGPRSENQLDNDKDDEAADD
ncbi:pseudouridylate synthase 1 homolog [Phymastichus coffea]|uniref:pseudouridylate synthase 1 homolog n=1 Tax=Phymastichus coffea TaxID=108790 RepID=UPI00273C3D74|nr:pseudouridylate synthase 1 homolog [Phymastichus coffea]